MGRVTAVAALQVHETATLLPLARRVKQRLRWRCTDTAALRRVAAMLNDNQPDRHLPADVLLDVMQVTGRRDFMNELDAEWGRICARLDDAKSMRRVAPNTRGREECA